MSRHTKLWVAGVVALVIALAPATMIYAQAAEKLTLDQLLAKVKEGWRAEAAANRKRESDFKSNRAEQKRLLEQASSMDRPVRLQCMRVNPRALAFYERHGFATVGGDETHLLLESGGSSGVSSDC